MHRYRVFISYSHDDREYAQKLADILEENTLQPIWDKNINRGSFFDEQIKDYIAHSHVFMPVITAASTKRGWVHQEIGYASALHIPLLPVSIGRLPGEMMQRLQAVMLDNALSNAKEELSSQAVGKLVEGCKPIQSAYFYTELSCERAQKIAEAANYVKWLGFSACIRQKGGCSSFQIPNKILSNPVWEQRYYPATKDEAHCRDQLNERRALEEQARSGGCMLIVNPALILAERYHAASKRARLETFLDFLKSMPDDRIDVAFDDRLTFSESVTIIGDWFATESYYRSEAQGFKHSIFTCHAPGIMRKIRAFDEEFDALLEENGVVKGRSREAAAERIAKLLETV